MADNEAEEKKGNTIPQHTYDGDIDNLDHDDEGEHDLSGEVAGVVRGVSRSIVRGPLIGRLPAAQPSGSSLGKGILRRRLPARQVARVSDRMATGLDVYSSAVESTDDSGNPKADSRKAWPSKLRSFGWNLFRNTLLGMAVFESYGYVIALADDVEVTDTYNKRDNSLTGHIHEAGSDRTRDNSRLSTDEDVFGDQDDASTVFGEPDEYTRASLPMHFFAGSVAGSVHGMASIFVEGNPTLQSTLRYITWNTLHHTMAHGMLFGSYETFKRAILRVTEDEERMIGSSRTYHVLTFSLAGGLAGLVQHLVTHYVEGGLGLANETLQIDWRPALRRPPAVRPLVLAFPPSAIGFVAFEYGKQFVS